MEWINSMREGGRQKETGELNLESFVSLASGITQKSFAYKVPTTQTETKRNSSLFLTEFTKPHPVSVNQTVRTTGPC